MRTLQNPFKERKSKSKPIVKLSLMKKLRKELKRAIEQENINMVKDLLTSSLPPASNTLEILFKEQENESTKIRSNQSKLNVIEKTSQSFSCPVTTALKRRASSDVTLNCGTRRKQKTSNDDWQRRLRIDDIGSDNALHYASRLGKTCFIDLLLESGLFGIDEPNWSNERDTALGIACEYGWLDTAKVLIARGADVNYENECGKTPLILATELVAPYDLEMCRMLIENGADINQITSSNKNQTQYLNPLLSACSYDNNELIRYLISQGAHIDPPVRADNRYSTTTPLMRCVYNGNVEMADYLLSKDARVNACNSRNETPLYVAAYRGYLQLVKVLVEKYNANVNSTDKDGDTPLSVACYAGRKEIVRYLLEKRANPRSHGMRGDTPLHIATANGDRQMCFDLILHGADVDACNDDNESVLHVACRSTRLRILRMLLARSKHIDVFSMSDYTTPLRILAENLTRNRLKMALDLLRAGSDVNLAFKRDLLGSEWFDLRTLIGQDSVFDFLFGISKNRFKLDEINVDDNDADDENNSTSSQTTTRSSLTQMEIEPFVRLIFIVIKSGYETNKRDQKLYKDSWLRNYLVNSPILNNMAKELDTAFSNEPMSLKDICRIQIRNCLAKPLRQSILELEIPMILKQFLAFEIINY